MKSPEIFQPKNFNPEEVYSKERYTIAPLRELNLESEKDLSDYFRLLTHPSNIEHFSSPPADTQDLKRKLTRDNTHSYLAENMLGEVLGAGGINDASEGEHDHSLVRVVVSPDYKGTDIEKKLFGALTDKAFTTTARDERERVKLDVVITRNVDGWEGMPNMFEQLGFRPLHIMLEQVDVFDQRLRQIVRKPTERWEISREDWLIRKDLREKANVQPN